MGLIKKQKIIDGVYWLHIPEIGLKILCGCPADSIKHLALKGLLPQTKKDGVTFESGPNAILLSDVLLQNGDLSNLSEFPILHMFYLQGMILPNHPNNNGQKPLLIGRASQIQAQLDYIYRGSYGLVDEKEFLAVGESSAFARENLLMKMGFSPGNFVPMEELIDGVFLENQAIELKPGLLVERLRENVFEFRFKNDVITINLNLRKNHKYKSPYSLPTVDIPNHYFAVIHCGEGDGWNAYNPCLSSLLIFKGKRFLVDAGPNVLRTLKALRLNPNKIDGVFFTHVHDDHFAGIYTLINSNSKIRILATPVVRSTIQKKLAALLSITEDKLNRFFVFEDLIRDDWNKFQGLEVKPITMAHPVDNTIFIFRVKHKNGYRTYGHYSDIPALKWLKKMTRNNGQTPGVSQSYYNTVKDYFDLKLNLKKIDVGGPIIHGDAEDFAHDKSGRLVLGHVHTSFTKRQLEIGDQVEFGDIDILIE